MMSQEAIQELKAIQDNYDITLHRYNALDEAIDALKLIDPKKPKSIKRIIGTYYFCPECKHKIKRIFEYCPECGQAIDWGIDV